MGNLDGVTTSQTRLKHTNFTAGKTKKNRGRNGHRSLPPGSSPSPRPTPEDRRTPVLPVRQERPAPALGGLGHFALAVAVHVLLARGRRVAEERSVGT